MIVCTRLPNRKLIGVLFSFFMLAGICRAQERTVHQPLHPLDTGKVYTIDGVTVKSSRFQSPLISPMPVQTLRGKDLKKLNSFSVADAIRYFSGVQLKDYGGIGGLKTINVRSMGSAHTSVFYDGIVIGNAQNGQVDLGKFSLDNIEAIELFNGQKSSIFQPARGFFASNTLFMQSKTPKFEEDENHHAKLSFKTGSFGLINPSMLYERKLNERLSLAFNTEYITASGKYKYRYQKENGYDTTATRQNGDIESFRAELTLHQQFKSGGKASLKTYFYDSERGLPGAIVANIFSHYQRLWDKNFFVQGMLQKSLFENHELMVNVKYSKDYNRYIDPDYQTIEGALDNRYYQSEFYTSLVNQYSITNWWDVSLAADYSFNTLDANLYRFPYPTRSSYYLALSSAIHRERLEIQANLLGAYVNEKVKYYQKGDDQHVFNPVLSASYQPFSSKENFRIRAFYKESFRMPTFNDLYYTFVGNTFLRPEFTTQYNLGATWQLKPNKVFDTFSLQADAYYNRVKDKIIAMPSANLFRWTMMNLGEVEVKGLEANLKTSRKFSHTLVELGMGYTYQQAIDITESSTVYGDQIPYIPMHSGTLTSSASYQDWQLNLSFIYTGERYSQKANIPVNYVQPWYTSDLGLTWKKSFGKYQYAVGVEANNLFNQYYDVVLNFPMPGRNYRLQFNISI
jgi:outer membrane cobalamin receptor